MSADLLSEAARISPDRPALLFDEETISYRALERRTAAAAGRLREMGIGEGDTVAVRSGSCVAWVALAHAIPRLGAILAPLNTHWTPQELRSHLARSRAKIIIADGELPEGVAARALAIAGIDAPHASPVEGAREIDPDRPQSLIFTSGTTGASKGAILTAGNHEAAARIAVRALGMTESDRWLAALPLFHIGGLNVLYRAALARAAVILRRGFDPGEANRAIVEEGATIVSFVERMLRLALERRVGRPYPRSLRAIVVGGGPVARELIASCPQALASYGLTEACSMATLAPIGAGSEERASSGRVLPGIELRIVGDGGAILPPGSEGRIELRGATVMRGYLDDPQATREALRDGWLVTNDIGEIDDRGFLRVSARREDLIISGGENIYPAEIEACLLAHPRIADAAVVGIADPDWGQRPLAVVVPRIPPPSVREISGFLGERLAAYKIPRVVFASSLPYLPTGKPDRARLRSLHDDAGGIGPRERPRPG